MISKTKFYLRRATVPAENIAIEAFLTESVPAETCVLYLWQNRKTVVIGRNQNAWRECRVDALERDGGFLARRLSGGGAVFHYCGNLNFTFAMNSADYDLERQLAVILDAVRALGVPAEKSGRNDILASGKKFSGNAFYHHAGKSYHHGTLMVDVALDSLADYLNVPAEKLVAKGVSSVRSRVANLADFVPGLTIAQLAAALRLSFEKIYGSAPEILRDEDFENVPRVSELTQKFASWEWRLGRKMPFSWRAETRFPWGGFEIRALADAGKIVSAEVFSDAMDDAFPREIATALAGAKFGVGGMLSALAPLADSPQLTDVRKFISEQNL